MPPFADKTEELCAMCNVELRVEAGKEIVESL